MSAFVRACSFSGLAVNVAKRFELNSTEPVAIVRLPDDSVVAVSDVCCHKEAKMSKGDIEDLGPSVSTLVGDGSAMGGICLRCPKHRKKFAGGLYFNAITGKSYVKGPCEKYKPEWRLPTYETRIIGDAVYVSPVPKAVNDTTACDDGEVKCSDVIPSSMGLGNVPPPSVDTRYHSWVLTNIAPLSTDSSIYTFTRRDGVVSEDDVLAKALRCHCWHVSLKLSKDSTIARDYTPVSTIEQWYSDGTVDILIKIYPDGELTSQLVKLSLGTVVEMSMPEVTLYLPHCITETPTAPLTHVAIHDVLLIAGGTGIAPFAQLLNIALDPAKAPLTFNGYAAVTRFSVLVSNHTERDQLWASHLNDMQSKHPDSIRLLYTLTSADVESVTAAWSGALGRINADMINWLVHWDARWLGSTTTPCPSPIPQQSLGVYRRSVVLCGPQGLMDAAQSLLLDVGVPEIVALDV